jgi:hypothetical protein
MDYEKSFQPVGFTDAESVMAFSDAQNVDYGLGINPATVGRGRVMGADNGPAFEHRNALQESQVSQFGSVYYPFGDTEKKRKTRAIPVAAKLAKGGPGRTAGYTTGVKGGGGLVGSAARPADALVKISGSGINRQKETALPIVYFGQLGG